MTAQATSHEFVRNILRLLSPALKERLLAANLLPLKLKVDAEAQQHSLLLATHDPSHPRVRQVVESLGMSAEVYYAPEAVVRDFIDRADRQEDAASEAALDENPERPPLPVSSRSLGSHTPACLRGRLWGSRRLRAT